MQRQLKPPILLIGFSRPDLTRRVLAQIRKVRPIKLYLALDGARNNVESKKVDDVKKLYGQIDWKCKVKTLYADKNYGTKYGPLRAISWFFKNEEMGIILEDDVLPAKSFFYYCEELLDKYKNDERIGTISGNNFSGISDTHYSYMFSKYSQTWGWATWKRVWGKYDPKIKDWPQRKAAGWLSGVLRDWSSVLYWKMIFDALYSGEIESAWDYQWTYMSWLNNFLTIIPQQNLVTNIGIGTAEATHTKLRDRLYAYPKHEIAMPLLHPTKVETNRILDIKIQKNYVLWKEFVVGLLRKIGVVKR